jgi:iron complex transport system substrate-binding protein
MKMLCALLCVLSCAAVRAEVRVTDDAGRDVVLAAPARRIVSLAPHVTELLYAAGAGAQVVGAVQYSDYPEAAKALPRVGGYTAVDMEAVIALRPDLVVVWKSGNRNQQYDKLEKLGIPVFVNEPRSLEDVARALETIGRLAGTETAAGEAAHAFRVRRDALAAQYSKRPPIDVFYQIWNKPLMTINGKHLISDVMALCGGRNVFAQLPILAPTVTEEAVLAAAPQVIIASGMGQSRPEWLDAWRRWDSLPAVVGDNLYFIPPEILQRHTPRILDGATRLCEQLDAARSKKMQPR